MNICTDNMQGSPSCTIEARKQDDGSFLATCISFPELRPEKAETEIEAIRGMISRVQRYVGDGRRDSRI